jgi:hypothetical protein
MAKPEVLDNETTDEIVAPEATETEAVETEGNEEAVVDTAEIIANFNLNHEHWEGLRKTLRNSTKLTMETMKEMAIISLLKFHESGNLNHMYAMQADVEEYAAGFLPLSGYNAWMCKYAPVVYNAEKKKHLKDVSDEAREFNIAGAIAEDFWNLSAEAKVQGFTPLDIANAVKALAKRYANENKYKATSASATEMLKKVANFAETLAA